MKHSLLILSFILLGITLTAQHIPLPDTNLPTRAQAKNLTVNGLKEGLWGEYVDMNYHVVSDTNSSNYRLGSYLHDTIQGMATIWVNELLLIEIPYINGMKDGIAKAYLNYYTTIPFKTDKVNGLVKYFFYNNYDGVLFKDCPYVDGITDGTAREYDENGRVSRETLYIKGKEVSDNAYNEEGKMVDTPFLYHAQYPDSGFTNKAEAKNLTINGKKEGKWVEYYSFTDGFPDLASLTEDTSKARYYCLVCYKKGRRIGIQRQYSMSGALQSEVHFDSMGKLNGMCREYYSNGKIMNEGMMEKDGIVERPYKEYYEDGKLKSINIYEGDGRDSIINYDENGNEIKDEKK